MAASLTLIADTTEGKHFEITLDQTSDDKGQVRVMSWHSNKDHRRDPPTRDDIIDLFDICFETKESLVCKGDMLGSNPVVTCTFNGAESETPSSVEVVIKGTFGGLADGTTRYTLPKDDYAELEEFFAEANFKTRVTI
jgi:hypothetical protein